MIKITDPYFSTWLTHIALSASEHHGIKKVQQVKPRSDGSVSFKLDGEDYSATFKSDGARLSFIRRAEELGVLEVA